MLRLLIVLGLLLVWSTAATCLFGGSCLFAGFTGSFLRTFLGYALIIAFIHFVYLLLPKLGIGSDPRTSQGDGNSIAESR